METIYTLLKNNNELYERKYDNMIVTIYQPSGCELYEYKSSGNYQQASNKPLQYWLLYLESLRTFNRNSWLFETILESAQFFHETIDKV